MVGLFAFRSRSPDRDLRTDGVRFGRLRALLDEISVEIERERAGLVRRIDAQARDAGFLGEAIDNGDAPPALGARLDDLGSGLRSGEKRLTELSRQASLLDGMRSELVAFQQYLKDDH